MKRYLLPLVVALLSACAPHSQEIVIDSEGVGDLKYGIAYDQIPESIDNLYTRYERVDESDGYNGLEATYNFYNDNELTMQHQLYDETYGFQYATIFSKDVATTIGLRVGDNGSRLLEFDAVADQTGALSSFYVDDYLFCIDKMTPSFYQKAERCYRYGEELELEASDFDHNSVISSITTYAVE